MTTSTTKTKGQSALFAPAKTFPNRLENSRANQLTKRIIDVVVSMLVIILVLAWMVPLIGLFIKLDSQGPVFFPQKRSGRRRNPFVCYKFRTMRHAPQGEKFVQATANDPRVTKLGHFLRRTSLDEFPQFINVFLGQMSLVGPRPHPLPLDERYGEAVPDYYERNTVMPGITGLAQIKGCRGETATADDMAERVRLDLNYTRQWSFWLDCKIMAWTLQDVITQVQKSVRPKPKQARWAKVLQWNKQLEEEVDAKDQRLVS